MIPLPQPGLPCVLDRVDSIWHPGGAPHHLLYGTSGSGKTTLMQQLLGLCPDERVVIFDPKPTPDPVWRDPAWPGRWGTPVTELQPMFGYRGVPGGGPAGMWFRLCGTPDREMTARRFAEALTIIHTEGHTVPALDDVREICRQLRLAELVDSILNLGRSARVAAILSATETSYVAGRAQGSMIWIGHTGGQLPAAKAAAGLLGWRGRDREDLCASIPPHWWIFSEKQPGNTGPAFVCTPDPRIPR